VTADEMKHEETLRRLFMFQFFVNFSSA